MSWHGNERVRNAALCLWLSVAACRPAAQAVTAEPPRGERLYAMLVPEADFRLELRPRELSRVGEELSIDHAAAGAALGMARHVTGSDHVIIASKRQAGREQITMALLGVPAALGPDDVRGERGEALLKRCAEELPVPCFEPQEAGIERRLYVVEPRRWLVAAGAEAITGAEAALRSGERRELTEAAAERTLWQLRYRGDTLVTRVPKLRGGPLAPLAIDLDELRIERRRGSSELHLIATYRDAGAAEDAEVMAEHVLGAWKRLGRGSRAATLERAGATLTARLQGVRKLALPGEDHEDHEQEPSDDNAE